MTRPPDRRRRVQLAATIDPSGTADMSEARGIYNARMAKHLVDLDEEALGAARSELGTTTIRETVNEALRRVGARREHRVAAALDRLAAAHLDDRADAWR